MKNAEIKRILIPTDFSETGQLALEHGIYMADLFKAQIYLLHVIELYEYPYTIYEPLVMIPPDTDELQENVKTTLREEAEKIKKQYDLQVIPLVSTGRVAGEIAEAVKEHNIDMIVMGTHGAKGFEEFFIGSNAHRTVTLADCPVITVQTHAEDMGFNNIVMPIDNTLHSRQKVDMVIELASRYGAFVHLLGLIREDENEQKFMLKIESVEKALQHAHISYKCDVKKASNVAVEAMSYSDKVNADLIVTMTDHESHLNGIFLGPFAKQIINHSKTPVLSIRPLEGNFEYQNFGSNSYA